MWKFESIVGHCSTPLCTALHSHQIQNYGTNPVDDDDDDYDEKEK